MKLPAVEAAGTCIKASSPVPASPALRTGLEKGGAGAGEFHWASGSTSAQLKRQSQAAICWGEAHTYPSFPRQASNGRRR